MSRPCGQRRACGSRQGRQGSTVLPRIRRACTGPNEGAVKVANTHGCSATDSGTSLPPMRPGADELAGVAFVDGRAGRADGLAAVAARGEQHAAGLGTGVEDRGEFAGSQVNRVDPARRRIGWVQPPVAVYWRVAARKSAQVMVVSSADALTPGPEIRPGVRGTVAAVPMGGLPSVAGRPAG